MNENSEREMRRAISANEASHPLSLFQCSIPPQYGESGESGQLLRNENQLTHSGRRSPY